MNKDQTTYELIEQYLQGQLEGETLADFERQLEMDAELRAELAVQSELHSLLGDTEVQDLDAKLDVLSKEYTQAKVVKLQPSRGWWLAAAAMLALTLAYLGLFRNQAPDGLQLFNTYYEPYSADVISRADPDSLDAIDRALLIYGEERYQEAEELLASIVDADTRVKFYRGLCLLQLNENEQALEQFNAVTLDDNSVYQVPAQWYAALTLLRMELETEAVELLQDISKSASGKYQTLANELLSDLE